MKNFKDIFNLFLLYLNKIQSSKKLAIILIIAATLSAIATYSAITRSSNLLDTDSYSIQGLILVNLVLFLALTIVISRRLFSLWIRRNKIIEGSRLQTRIVLMFSLVSSIPTIIVAIFSVLFFNYGIESWFNERVSTALSESVAVAEHYFIEHTENIKADAFAMASDLNAQAYELYNNIGFFNKVVSSQALLRLLSEGLVFRGDKMILAKTNMSFSLIYELERLPQNLIQRASNGEIVILTNDTKDRVRALIKLDKFFDTYLLVGRPVDKQVIEHMHNTQGAVNEYKRLKSQISSLRIQFLIIFVIVSLLLLLTAIWLGILFASALVKPISTLIYITEKIKIGDLSARIEKVGPENDEIATLERAFNLMADRLEYQRNELIAASKQIDSRRHFSETILTELSSGVIALSINKRITMLNRAAGIHLNILPKEVIGKNFNDVCNEMEELLDEAMKNTHATGEIVIVRGGRKAIWLVSIIVEKLENDIKGFIITFDDITALVNAQRSAAWADVARRIAHEIKNPLTPIKLAAERIKKKYSNEISDVETFNKYNETIIRHATEIGKIVEEFVNFARMPPPNFTNVSLINLIKDTIFSRKCVCPNIKYIVNIPETSEIIINCDPAQINQAITNLLKNSEEAIESVENNNGIIEISLTIEENFVVIIIIDNGEGFPTKIFERLTEPYITTKTKGTGLGLAIVKKILIDHNATLEFFNSEEEKKGAMVKIKFPL
ncbi:MAG: ATP-binding protein [Alphaproteobacteria bacterium]